MSPPTRSNPVLIVGAGSTGLMLACELARHGAPVRIVDRLAGIAPYARATGLHSRTLEVFHDLGIAEEVIARAALIRGARQFAGGELVMHLRSDGLDSPFPFSLSLEQWKVEEALEALLLRLGVAVERETELLELEESDDCVRASLRLPDGSTAEVETPWLIGCDGAHSRVRHLKGEHFPGDADPRQYLVADVVLDGWQAIDEVQVYLTDRGALWWFPLPDGRNLVAGDMPEQHDGAAETPSLEDVQALLDHRAPPGLSVRDPRWLSWFHINYRLTPHYRHGRTFLAGDAAHIHSPIGGQGMNTGIQDAYNLGWKLALVTAGIAPRSLLDSYEAERRAVAEGVLAMTRALTEKAEAYVVRSPEERDRLSRHVVLPEVERMQMLLHNEELDLDYRSSFICKDCVDGPEPEDQPVASLRAGFEARDAKPLLVDGELLSFFDLLRGTHHTLLLVPGSGVPGRAVFSALEQLAAMVTDAYGTHVRSFLLLPPDTAERASNDGPAVVIHDPEGALNRRYGASGGRIYLIRPDGYIGFRGEPDRHTDLMEHLKAVFL